jgi:nitroreductase
MARIAVFMWRRVVAGEKTTRFVGTFRIAGAAMNAPVLNTRIPDHPVADLFPARWSPRAFSEAVMTEAEVLLLLEAARWAPSASNVQPWRFAWGLRGDAGFAAIAGALVPFNRAWAEKASALIVVASRRVRDGSEGVVDNPWHGFDAGTAWGLLAMQAQMSGFHAHAMGGFDHAVAAQALGLPEDHALHAVVAVGKLGDPAQLPEALRARETPSQRLPLAALAGRGKFPV